MARSLVLVALFVTSAIADDRPADTASATKEAPTKAPAAESEREKQQHEERRQYEQRTLEQFEKLKAEANRPTQWQLQNPSGAQNRFATEPPRGYIAPNTYYGSDHRSWSNMSAPVMLSRVPATYYTPPPAIFSNAPLAPNTSWGAANMSWTNIREGTVVPSATGGWNYVR